jgi:hypothetical protein
MKYKSPTIHHYEIMYIVIILKTCRYDSDIVYWYTPCTQYAICKSSQAMKIISKIHTKLCLQQK